MPTFPPCKEEMNSSGALTVCPEPRGRVVKTTQRPGWTGCSMSLWPSEIAGREMGITHVVI